MSLKKLEILHLWPKKQDNGPLLIFVQVIRDLPAFMSFKLFQPGFHTSTYGEMDLLRNSGEKKHWPRLHHLELNWTVRTVADLEAFLASHISHGLKTLLCMAYASLAVGNQLK